MCSQYYSLLIQVINALIRVFMINKYYIIWRNLKLFVIYVIYYLYTYMYTSVCIYIEFLYTTIIIYNIYI